MKHSKTFVVFSFAIFVVLILSISVVSAFSIVDWLKKIFGRQKAQLSPEEQGGSFDLDGNPICVDARSTTTYGYDTYADFCINNSLGVNYYCASDGALPLTSNVTCGAEQICQNGACVQNLITQNCVDNDKDGLPDYDANLCPLGTDRCIQSTITDWTIYQPRYENMSSIDIINTSYESNEDFRNMTNFTFFREGFAHIMFRERMRIVDVNATGCFAPLNLSKLILFEDKRVVVHSENFSEFGKAATIRFENISFVSPKILKDGAECTTGLCNITSYDSVLKRLIVEIPGFSTYEVVEGYLAPPPGDGGTTGGSSGGSGGDSAVIIRARNATNETGQQAGNVTQPETEGEQPTQEIEEETPQREITKLNYVLIGTIITFAIGIIVAGYLILRNLRRGASEANKGISTENVNV